MFGHFEYHRPSAIESPYIQGKADISAADKWPGNSHLNNLDLIALQVRGKCVFGILGKLFQGKVAGLYILSIGRGP